MRQERSKIRSIQMQQKARLQKKVFILVIAVMVLALCVGLFNSAKSKTASKSRATTVRNLKITNFAQILIRLLPCQLNEMEFALGELIDNDVLQIDGCNLQQKRMIKDGLISDARSEAAKKGGGNPNLFKQKPKGKYKQKPKQNTEDEYDNDIEVVNDIKIKPEIVKSEIETTFEEFEKMRIKLKKPMTDYAKELIKKELIKLSGSDEQLAIKILNQSIENSWQDVYPLKYKTVKNGSNQKKDELSEMGDAFKRTLVNRLNKIENGK